MSMETWGLVPKSQTENLTIDDAIAAAIVDHEADPHAHQGDGESLQNHKSNEVIDHPADSIVNDKYEDFSVSPDKIINDKFYLAMPMESIDAWSMGTNGAPDYGPIFGGAQVEIGSTAGKYAILYNADALYEIDFTNKKPCQETTITISTITNIIVYFGFGQITGKFAGWKFVNDSLKAVWNNGSGEHTHDIATITASTAYKIKTRVLTNGNIEFYLNNVLQYTATTYLPTGTEDGIYFALKVTTPVSGYKGAAFYYPIFYQDL